MNVLDKIFKFQNIDNLYNGKLGNIRDFDPCPQSFDMMK